MFEPTQNPGYDQLSEDATGLIVQWVNRDWYESSSEAESAKTVEPSAKAEKPLQNNEEPSTKDEELSTKDEDPSMKAEEATA